MPDWDFIAFCAALGLFLSLVIFTAVKASR